MARITFSIPDDLAKAAERRAAEDRRSLSAHISILVERDARAAGMINGEDSAKAELLAAADEVGIENALHAVVKLKRTKRRAA